MPSGADLKVLLQAFLAEQQVALAALDAGYQAERTRVLAQIAGVQNVLGKWDAKVEGLVDTLASAGIQVRTS